MHSAEKKLPKKFACKWLNIISRFRFCLIDKSNHCDAPEEIYDYHGKYFRSVQGLESTCEVRRHQCNTLWNLGIANGILSKDADCEVSSMMIWLDAFGLWASLNTCIHHQPAHPEEEKQAFSLDHNPQPWSQCKALGQQCLTWCVMEPPPTDVYHLDPLSYAPQWIWGENPWLWALRRLGAAIRCVVTKMIVSCFSSPICNVYSSRAIYNFFGIVYSFELTW